MLKGRSNTPFLWLLVGVVIGFIVIKFVFLRHHITKYDQEEEEEETELLGPDNKRTICNPRQFLCERKRDQLFDGLHKIDAQELVHNVMTHMTFKCHNIKTLGVRGHGGYEACMDKSFEFQPHKCLVYSFGIRNGYSFETAVIDQYGCEVHTFDPEVEVTKEEQETLDNWNFHSIGLWGDDFDNTEGYQMRRLSTIVKMLGHENRIIDMVKIDGQGAEWPFFRDMALHYNSLDNVKQIAFSAYAPRRKPREQVMRMTDYSQIFRSISYIKKLGFRNFYYHAADMNQGCCNWWADLVPPVVSKAKIMICCYQSFMVNMNYLV